MENENENFDQLKKLLALKKHELPPPGYFNKLPGEVVSRIRAQRTNRNMDGMAKLNAEAPWLMKLWRTLEGKPAFAGAFGTAICALVLAAIFFAEKPPTQPVLAAPHNTPTMGTAGMGAPLAVSPGGEGFAVGGGAPVMLAATNVNLFELASNGPTIPASFRP